MNRMNLEMGCPQESDEYKRLADLIRRLQGSPYNFFNGYLKFGNGYHEEMKGRFNLPANQDTWKFLELVMNNSVIIVQGGTG